MTGTERANYVLDWIDHCSDSSVEKARKSCRGRKDVDRLRTALRLNGWPSEGVSLMTEAAQHKDLEFMLRLEWARSPRTVLVHERRAVLR